MTQALIQTGSRVCLHFALELEDGQVIDSTFAQAQAPTLVIGDGNLPPSFETCLEGMGAGQEATYTLPPEQAFGQHNPSNVQRFAKDQFAGQDLERGLVLSFTDASGSELPGVVAQIQEKSVLIDFNHPLAGRTLIFKVKILHVEAP
ncbi:FKBP-type peptidyl-prolyl cis-trans isomerase SlpA [Allopseudospirillum japonicum]|uniref:Peptidyl-prolyl cis-trans isomerase n=1 Tax=Allopseudospirillum japonicum TaxID=64971 RepID=A0A1H6SVU6_9GAMM|nr:FKBP-type peptidyl-prolyl cis-trans isomerase [Allopseudospirillum japonicum]SEI68085.1 FKBP-type peptidyl-prolyl cis-trans isomerase SlpA [Allopseudospirillum japonicum]